MLGDTIRTESRRLCLLILVTLVTLGPVALAQEPPTQPAEPAPQPAEPATTEDSAADVEESSSASTPCERCPARHRRGAADARSGGDGEGDGARSRSTGPRTAWSRRWAPAGDADGAFSDRPPHSGGA